MLSPFKEHPYISWLVLTDPSLFSPSAHLIRIKRRTSATMVCEFDGFWGWVGEVRADLLREGQFLEWSDPSGSSKIVWWAGLIPMRSQLWMFNAFSQMQTVIRRTRQWSLSYGGKKRKREVTFIGAFLETAVWEKKPISKEEITPLLQRGETGVHNS